jgi:hypothetical protein
MMWVIEFVYDILNDHLICLKLNQTVLYLLQCCFGFETATKHETIVKLLSKFIEY